jgi:hypothetical protein
MQSGPRRFEWLPFTNETAKSRNAAECFPGARSKDQVLQEPPELQHPPVGIAPFSPFE